MKKEGNVISFFLFKDCPKLYEHHTNNVRLSQSIYLEKWSFYVKEGPKTEPEVSVYFTNWVPDLSSKHFLLSGPKGYILSEIISLVCDWRKKSDLPLFIFFKGYMDFSVLENKW